MDIEEELNTVYCRVSFLRANRLLVNEKIAQEMTNQAIERIRRYGVKCTEQKLQPIGGGSEVIWSSLFKYFWDANNFLGVAVTFQKWVWFAVRSFFVREFVNSKPTLLVSLKIEKKTDEDGWHAPIGDKLVDLKHLAQDLTIWLKEQYPVYSFDQQIQVSLYPEEYRVSIYQRSNQCSSFQNGRLVKRLRLIKEHRNLEIHIMICKLIFLKQTVSRVAYKSGWIEKGKSRHYYTVFSSILIARFKV